MFYVGQKVVCIKEYPSAIEEGYIAPVKGGVYTIRDSIEWYCKPVCRLVEIVNPVKCYIDGEKEGTFLQNGFRPLVDKKTDITLFQEIARSPGKLEEVV